MDLPCSLQVRFTWGKTINFNFELDLTPYGDVEEGNMSEGQKERLSDLRN
jgi:hypothetical protein